MSRGHLWAPACRQADVRRTAYQYKPRRPTVDPSRAADDDCRLTHLEAASCREWHERRGLATCASL